MDNMDNMTEFELELERVLGREIALPSRVEERVRWACAQAQKTPGTARRRPWRAVLIGVGAAAVLAASAAAVSAANHGTVFQLFFGDESRQSSVYVEEYDQYGNFWIRSLNEERVSVDMEQAEALVGEYLSDTSYVWQIGEYTLTVEGYLLDENTGVGKIAYSLYRPGGLEGIVVDEYTGCAHSDGSGIAIPLFCFSQGESDTYAAAGYYSYADLSRSTEDTLYLETALAAPDWLAECGLRVEWNDYRLLPSGGENAMLVTTLELPGVKSLPAVTVADPETGEEAVCLSAIGMVLQTPDIDLVRYVALEFADGTRYVVEDHENRLSNSDYALGSGSSPNMELRYCFDRLVDPAQVTAVTVDGAVYPVG